MRSKVVDLAAIRGAPVLQANEYCGDLRFKGGKIEMPDMERWLGEKETLYNFEAFICKVLSQSDRQMERLFRTFGETRKERIGQMNHILKCCDGWADCLAHNADAAEVVLYRIYVIYHRMWGRAAVEVAVAEARERQLERARAGINGNVSPHWLRHAHGSHALERGAALLSRDHSRIDGTIRGKCSWPQ